MLFYTSGMTRESGIELELYQIRLRLEKQTCLGEPAEDIVWDNGGNSAGRLLKANSDSCWLRLASVLLALP